MAAALATVVSSLLASETTPIPVFQEMTKVANAKVTAWRRAARKEKGKDAALGPMFGTTWGDKTLGIPYGKLNASRGPFVKVGTGLDFQRTYAFEGTEGP